MLEFGTKATYHIFRAPMKSKNIEKLTELPSKLLVILREVRRCQQHCASILNVIKNFIESDYDAMIHQDGGRPPQGDRDPQRGAGTL